MIKKPLYKVAGLQKRRKWKEQEEGKARTSAARPGGDNFGLRDMEIGLVVVMVMFLLQLMVKETDYMCVYVNVDDAKWIDRKKQQSEGNNKNGKAQVLTKAKLFSQIAIMGLIT